MKQPYFKPNDDLSRCSVGQHLWVWTVWSLIHARRRQNLGPRPRWRELVLSWLLHHCPGLMLWFTAMRQRMIRLFR